MHGYSLLRSRSVIEPELHRRVRIAHAVNSAKQTALPRFLPPLLPLPLPLSPSFSARAEIFRWFWPVNASSATFGFIKWNWRKFRCYPEHDTLISHYLCFSLSLAFANNARRHVRALLDITFAGASLDLINWAASRAGE